MLKAIGRLLKAIGRLIWWVLVLTALASAIYILLMLNGEI